MSKIKITNPDKIIFKDGSSKLELINYYIDVNKLIMPHLKNRPLATLRCHSLDKKSCFFKKHPEDKSLIEVFTDKGNEYFYISNLNQLIYQVQLGTIEFHTWASNVKTLEVPQFMVFDLDPDENLNLHILQDACLKVKSVLDELNLISFLKTSGGKGYHIVVPFKKSKNWDSFYNFSKQIALVCEQKWQNLFTTNIKKNTRKNKIFIDYMRNNRSSTCVCPYSVRARDLPTISMPISWKNIARIKPDEVTIKNYKKYINNSWDDFFTGNQRLN